jgi:hypothetical protein
MFIDLNFALTNRLISLHFTNTAPFTHLSLTNHINPRPVSVRYIPNHIPEPRDKRPLPSIFEAPHLPIPSPADSQLFRAGFIIQAPGHSSSPVTSARLNLLPISDQYLPTSPTPPFSHLSQNPQSQIPNQTPTIPQPNHHIRFQRTGHVQGNR